MCEEIKWQGRCVICGVAGQSSKAFLCALCSDPEKLMLVCQCGRRVDLTGTVDSGVIDNLKAVIAWNENDRKDLRPGMTISVSKCFPCSGKEALEKEAAKDLKIYSVR